MLAPMPAGVIDVLLSANLAISVLMLLTALLVRTPLEFSIFPTLLLTTTLARLVLNLATTRLILTRADSEGLDAAGGVIQSFSQFVSGDRLLVGFILFLIIVLIQFVVITQGATRISEVAARFMLDGLPGRQMAIDADLNSGVIDQAESQRRRESLYRQADFYGAMDGASKFVKGDAQVGLAIMVVNLLGGLAIGWFEAGMSVTEALEVFTRLTIGDGLVSQVPAFLVSVAAGLLVTRGSASNNLPSEFLDQLFFRPQTLIVTAAFLGILALTGLPWLPLTLLGGGCLLGSALLLNAPAGGTTAALANAKSGSESETASPAGPAVPQVEDLLQVDLLELEIGVGLIRLADPQRGDLLRRIQLVRQNIASELGIILPKVRIRDNVSLERHQYRVKIADFPVATGTIRPARLLAIDWGRATEKIAGEEIQEPAYGMPAVWIPSENRETAEGHGYTVVEPASVLATHLTEIIRKHSEDLLTRDSVKQLLENLKKTAPAVVEDLVPARLSLGQVQRVLQQLLREGISLRNLTTIMESLGDYAEPGVSPDRLVEAVRQGLGKMLAARFRDSEGRLHVVTLDPAWQERLAAGVSHGPHGQIVQWLPRDIEQLRTVLSGALETFTGLGRPAAVLVDPRIRLALSRLLAQTASAAAPRWTVWSYAELEAETDIHSLGVLHAPEATLTAAK